MSLTDNCIHIKYAFWPKCQVLNHIQLKLKLNITVIALRLGENNRKRSNRQRINLKNI